MVAEDWFLTPDGDENETTREHIQVIDAWELADDDDADEPSIAAGDTASAKELASPPRSKAVRIKDHQAERALRSLISSILSALRYEEAAAYERRVGRRQIEEEADRRIAEYTLGFRTGVAPDSDPIQSVSASSASAVRDGSIPGVSILDPEGQEGFHAFKEFLIPVISRNFEKEGYARFVEALIMELVRDIGGEEVRRLSSGLARVANEMIREERRGERGDLKGRGPQGKTNSHDSEH